MSCSEGNEIENMMLTDLTDNFEFRDSPCWPIFTILSILMHAVSFGLVQTLPREIWHSRKDLNELDLLNNIIFI